MYGTWQEVGARGEREGSARLLVLGDRELDGDELVGNVMLLGNEGHTGFREVEIPMP